MKNAQERIATYLWLNLEECPYNLYNQFSLKVTNGYVECSGAMSSWTDKSLANIFQNRGAEPTFILRSVMILGFFDSFPPCE